MIPETAHLFSAYVRSRKIAFAQNTEWLHTFLNAGYHALQHPKLFHQKRLVGQTLKTRTSPVNLFVVGDENSGKSTLINALVGGEVVHATALPHLCSVHRHLYGNDRAIVYCKGARPFRATHLAARNYWDQEEQRCSANEEYISPLIQIDWYHEAYPFLKLCVVVDTPGFGKAHDIRKQNIEEYYYKADAVLWLFDATKRNRNTSLKVIDQVSRYSKKIVGVISKWDTVDNQENKDQVLEQIQRIFGKYVLAFVPISSEQAIKANIISDEESYQASNLPLLYEKIRTHFLASSGMHKNIHRYHTVRFALSEAAVLFSEEVNVAKQNLNTLHAARQMLRTSQSEAETKLSQMMRDSLKNEVFGDIYQLLHQITTRDAESVINSTTDQASLKEKISNLYTQLEEERDLLLREVRAKLDSFRYQEKNYRYDGTVAAVAEHGCYGEFPVPDRIAEVEIDITLGITYRDFISGFTPEAEQKKPATPLFGKLFKKSGNLAPHRNKELEDRHPELKDLANAQTAFQHQKIAAAIDAEITRNIDDCFARIENDVTITFLCRFGSEKDLELSIEKLSADRDAVKNISPLFAGEILNVLKKGNSILK